MQRDWTPEEPGNGHGDEGPQHGFRGAGPVSPASFAPAGLTVAISREAGARGGTIGRRAARALGWQVYDQELMEYLSQDGTLHQDVLAGLSEPAIAWVDEHLERLVRQGVDRSPAVLNLVRLTLALGARGGVVIIGRGAGFILPRESTLHVRLMAPLEERIAYLSQWLRLTSDEARQRVRVRDARRAEFLTTCLRRQPGEPYAHDLILNTGSLGEDFCVELITHAVRARGQGRSPGGSTPAAAP
jgi:Cytidylate kinase-like family